MLLRDRACFHIFGSLTAFLDRFIKYLVELPLLFFAGIREILFHDGLAFLLECVTQPRG
jgi:hypothetical protein